MNHAEVSQHQLHTVALGLDIGGTNIKSGIVLADGQLLQLDHTKTDTAGGKSNLLEKVIKLVADDLERCHMNGWNPVGVGIGTAGQVNKITGKIDGATSNLPDWAGQSLSALIEKNFGLQAVTDNDVNVMGRGEAWLGAGREWDDFICVTLGTGVGGCHIIHGQPYRGKDGYAGEFGHQVIVFDGLPCNCGNKGCWEQYASVTALKRLAMTLSQHNHHYSDPRSLFAQAQQGNELAEHVITQYVEYVSTGLVNLLHAFNPEGIVIGGAITAQGDLLFNRIRKAVYKHTLSVYTSQGEIHIVPAALGDSAGVIGAAKMAFDQSTGFKAASP